MALVTRTHIQKRFSDIDAFRHVNNVAQQVYFDVGKTDLFGRLRGCAVVEGISAVAVSVHTDFLSQIRFDDDIYVVSEVESVGNKSITLRQSIVRGEEVCSRSRTVLVAFDAASQCSVEVPAAWREAIAAAG